MGEVMTVAPTRRWGPPRTVLTVLKFRPDESGQLSWYSNATSGDGLHG